MNASNNLNSAIGKIEKEKKRMMKKVNDLRGKLGKKPIDFDGAGKKLMNTIMSGIRGTKNQAIQAKLSGTTVASAKPEMDKNEQDLLKKLKEKKKGGVEEKKKSEDFMSGLKFDFKKSDENSGISIDMEEEAQKMEDLDVLVLDITKNKGADIFRVISTRYFKTAYPRLLEEK